MWPLTIRPYIGASQDREPFAEWWLRVRPNIYNVPENVAEHWLHRHFGESPYAFLPLQRLRFERRSWTNEELDQVSFGESWRWTANDLNRLDDEHARASWLAANMIEHGTWPEPILILDNVVRAADNRGAQMGRWHLIEGHRRLTYLRCIANTGSAMPQHDVWVITIEPGATVTKPEATSGNVSPGYIWQKLSSAVESLAIEGGTIQQRLYSALRGGPLHLTSAAFPSEKREQWAALMEALARVDDPARGSMQASIEAMSDREASDHARTILELYEWCVREESASRSR